jgi:predicted metal-dependent enzyme (double-stranded beta helix superfamily)
MDLLDVARRWAADPAAWPMPPRFDPAQRWYARLAAPADHEVWLLTWLPGQHTDLHDHGGSAGAFVVVSGCLTEEALTRGRRGTGGGLRTARLPAAAHRVFGPRHVHRVANHGPDPAISLHVYAPALRSMTRYLVDGGRLRVAEVAQAGVSW